MMKCFPNLDIGSSLLAIGYSFGESLPAKRTPNIEQGTPNSEREARAISTLVVIIFLFQICSCKYSNQNLGKEYSFSDWNGYLNDTVKICYNLDTLFIEAPPIGSTWDGAMKHFSYSYDSVYISISYYWDEGRLWPKADLLKRGRTDIINIKAAGFKSNFEEPKLIQVCHTSGEYIMHESGRISGIIYWGQTDDFSTTFAVHITNFKRQIDSEKLLFKLLKSFRVERK